MVIKFDIRSALTTQLWWKNETDLALYNRDSQDPFAPSFAGTEHLGVFSWAYGHLKFSSPCDSYVCLSDVWSVGCMCHFHAVSLKTTAWLLSLLPYCFLERRHNDGGSFEPPWTMRWPWQWKSYKTRQQNGKGLDPQLHGSSHQCWIDHFWTSGMLWTNKVLPCLSLYCFLLLVTYPHALIKGHLI